jgi:hypothetical protein
MTLAQTPVVTPFEPVTITFSVAEQELLLLALDALNQSSFFIQNAEISSYLLNGSELLYSRLESAFFGQGGNQ